MGYGFFLPFTLHDSFIKLCRGWNPSITWAGPWRLLSSGDVYVLYNDSGGLIGCQWQTSDLVPRSIDISLQKIKDNVGIAMIKPSP